ncbi:alpha/beta hydrolase [Alphaproteobacteria bacterium]|nr:alpha/beta hydrolase [Alphaproteobacteria bacterium]
MAEIVLAGPEGRIEAKYHKSYKKDAPVALVLHPHPLHGGTMNNKVTYTTCQAFIQSGFNVLRFNFRGVGMSQGSFDNGEGELSDAACALDWLQAENRNAGSFWISGFSFGAWIAMQLLMRRPEIEGFISVSPPANMYDFNFLAPCPVSGLMIQGASDEIVPLESVNKLATKLSNQQNIDVSFKKIEGADHFFTGKLNILLKDIRTYLEKSIS